MKQIESLPFKETAPTTAVDTNSIIKKTYEMKKEELVKVLDQHVEALKRVQDERDELKMEIMLMKYPNETCLQKGTIQ